MFFANNTFGFFQFGRTNSDIAEQLSLAQQELANLKEKYDYEMQHSQQLNASIEKIIEENNLSGQEKDKAMGELQQQLMHITQELTDLRATFSEVCNLLIIFCLLLFKFSLFLFAS